ncbi:hypothetical protein M501DRAFT_1022612 [Patellaria atrata CBS 101060]|uniref:FAD/NAD(P)-binding domain-containing protein n=1 Tax=Patellaria atrata CBS 101060 TaxID=1346257 RepID=A0A9P4SEU8_9PEZI|nr:hypothetical protein M501DRAFT_1022612 [Patellaria atrata CBS 101060]
MSQKPLNIVILGASFSGVTVANNILNRVIEKLKSFEDAPTYQVILISPSTHVYWNICAPRALVSSNLITRDTSFIPIMPTFEEYPSEQFQFIQGTATSVDTSAKEVHISLITPVTTIHTSSAARSSHNVNALSSFPSQRLKGVRKSTGSKGRNICKIPYNALVYATGSSTSSPLLSLHGPHEETISALNSFQAKLKDAGSILIVGGGPSARSPITITLLSGHDRLLPNLPAKISKKAEKKLRALGVNVLHNIRLLAAKTAPDGQKTHCHLNNAVTVTSDLHILATGAVPNTGYFRPAPRGPVPTTGDKNPVLDEKGYITTDTDLRIWGAGDRIFATGDCAAYSRGCLGDVYDAVPVLVTNLTNDLVAYINRLRYQESSLALQRELNALVDARFSPNLRGSWLVPVTRFGGVGMVSGWRVPGWVVYLGKGRGWRLGRARETVGRGVHP